MTWRNKQRGGAVGAEAHDSHTAPDKSRRRCWNANGTSKRGFDKANAKRHAKNMAGPGWRRKGLQVYRCDICGWYHVGRNQWFGRSRATARGES